MGKSNIAVLVKLAHTTVTTNPYAPIYITTEIDTEEVFREFKKELEKLNDSDNDNVNDVWAFYRPETKSAVTVNEIALHDLREILQKRKVENFLMEKGQLMKRITRGVNALRTMKREDVPVVTVTLPHDKEIVTTSVNSFTEKPEYSDIEFLVANGNHVLSISYKKEASALVDTDSEEEMKRVREFAKEHYRRWHHKNVQKDNKDDEDGKALYGGFSKEAVEEFNDIIREFKQDKLWFSTVRANKEFPDLAGMRFGPDKEFPMMRYIPSHGAQTTGTFINLDTLAKIAGQFGIYPQEFGGTARTNGRMYTIAATIFKLSKVARDDKNYRVRVNFEEENWPYGSVKEGLAEVSKWCDCDVEEVGWLTFELTPKKGE